MRPIRLSPLSPEQREELHILYRRTKDVRVRTRAQMILLAAEHGRSASPIAHSVRACDQTVRNWLKRDKAAGLPGLQDAPRAGSPGKVTPAYVAQLVDVVRLRPRSLGLPHSRWMLARLADYMAEPTGMRVAAATVRVHLQAADIVLRRPQHQMSSPEPESRGKKRRLQTRVTPGTPVRAFTLPMRFILPGCPRCGPWGARKGRT